MTLISEKVLGWDSTDMSHWTWFLLCDFGFNAIWNRQYAVIFILTQFGIHNPWPFLCCVGG